MNKRQKALKELIKAHEIEDQQTLISLLKKRYGLESSQASISRDLRALGVLKRKINEKMVYDLHAPDVSKEILEFAVQGVQHNETLIVVHTMPGFPPVIGDYLEMRSSLPILSTLAGENVLFVVPESIKNIKEIYTEVCRALYVKEKLMKENDE